MKRTIVQIVVTPPTDDAYRTLYALCDDGSVWQISDRAGGIWRQWPDIPQDKEDTNT